VPEPTDAALPTGPAAEDLPKGTTIGEYQVLRRIGAGGMGTVYLAEHPVIGKQVAVKVLSTQLSQDGEAAARFVAEARAVNRIRHEHMQKAECIRDPDTRRSFLSSPQAHAILASVSD
jgi:serine/threonine protein kinase